MSDKAQPERIEIPVEDGMTPKEALDAALQPYIDANREYRKNNSGHSLYKFTMQTETDPAIGEVPVILVSRAAVDDVSGRSFEPFHELVLVNSGGQQLRTEKIITKEVNQKRQYEHDVMENYLTAKKNFVRVERDLVAIKRETFVMPEDEEAVAAKIAASLQSEYNAQDAAVEAVISSEEKTDD